MVVARGARIVPYIPRILVVHYVYMATATRVAPYISRTLPSKMRFQAIKTQFVFGSKIPPFLERQLPEPVTGHQLATGRTMIFTVFFRNSTCNDHFVLDF